MKQHVIAIISADKQKTSGEVGKMVNEEQGHRPIHLEFVLAAPDLDPVIKGLVSVIEAAEEKIAEQKRVVNGLCLSAGRPIMYADIERKSGDLIFIRTDEFYGQPLATAMRSVLEKKRAGGNGPATVREIYDALISGGFKFEAKDENALRGLRQSLTKNSAVFHKLPNGSYGLLEWYPNAKPARPGDDEEE